MRIQSTLKKTFVGWNSLYLLMMLVFGVWGAYDYWVKIPNQEIAAVEYEAFAEELRILQESEIKPLPEAQAIRYEEVKLILKQRFDNTPPSYPASYDRPLNLWVYFIGCGVLGVPWFAWKLIRQPRIDVTLEEDGSLVTRQGTFTADQITDINMAKWMSKSIASVSVEGKDEPIVLDDYVYQDTYLIVGKLAHRFHPDQWSEDGKVINATTEGDDSAEPTEDTETPEDTA
jgi:hypothetical protein